MSTTGVKHDSGKSRVDLLPPKAVLEVGHVLGHGAAVYGDDNWRGVHQASTRYLAAALRHLLKYMAGEKLDPDSGRSHLAHAACSILFVLELCLVEDNASSGQEECRGATEGARNKRLDELGL